MSEECCLLVPLVFAAITIPMVFFISPNKYPKINSASVLTEMGTSWLALFFRERHHKALREGAAAIKSANDSNEYSKKISKLDEANASLRRRLEQLDMELAGAEQKVEQLQDDYQELSTSIDAINSHNENLESENAQLYQAINDCIGKLSSVLKEETIERTD